MLRDRQQRRRCAGSRTDNTRPYCLKVSENAIILGHGLGRRRGKGGALIPQGARLELAQLADPDLSGIKLTGAFMKGADLSRCTLQGSNLRGPALTGAQVQSALLDGSDQEGCALQGANLDEAKPLDCNLQDAALDGATLNAADISYSNLEGTSLRGTSLVGAQATATRGTPTSIENALVARLTGRGDSKLLSEESIELPTQLAPLQRAQLGPQNCIAWSADGKTLASTSLDGTMRLWRTEDGVLLATSRPYIDGVNCVAWSPDGKFLASAGNNGQATVHLVGSLSHPRTEQETTDAKVLQTEWQFIHDSSGGSLSINSEGRFQGDSDAVLALRYIDPTVPLHERRYWHAIDLPHMMAPGYELPEGIR